MGEKSFYDLDYIIEINEHRLDQYATAYQKVVDRLTHIILVYSALTIFLVPIVQDGALFKIKNLLFTSFLILFLLSLLISMIFTIRLIIPVDIAYLDFPRKYYEQYRSEYEVMVRDKAIVKDLLKASYIEELQEALEISDEVFKSKKSFYYNAMIFALLSIIPSWYVYHFTSHEKRRMFKKYSL